MSDLYHALDNVLARKVNLYGEIIKIMNEEWSSITEYSRERLETALEKKEILLAKVHELNYEREDLVRALSEKLGRLQSEVTLKTIIGLKNNPRASSMAKRRNKIKEQIEIINTINLSNKQLINRSALALKQSMSWLYEVDKGYTPYYSNGQLSEPAMGSRVINTDI